jgi:PadR family transcriptional regulator, regulatory protein AphA
MPPVASKSVYAVLGFLTRRPMSGYDIKKRIDASIRNFWNENYGQIYPVLKQLTELGWATRSDDASSGARPRHVYTITETGREALREWLDRPVDPPVYRYEYLLKLFFGSEVDPATSLRQIEEHRRRSAEDLEHYRRIESEIRALGGSHSAAPYWLMTVRSGIYQREADLRWCDETIEALRELDAGESRAPQPAGASSETGP